MTASYHQSSDKEKKNWRRKAFLKSVAPTRFKAEDSGTRNTTDTLNMLGVRGKVVTRIKEENVETIPHNRLYEPTNYITKSIKSYI